MPKYLFQGSYTAEGTRGLVKDGGAKRRAAVEEMAQAIGGKVEAFYFALGEPDVFVIVDAPNNVSAAAVSLAVNASGGVALKTTALLTPEEMDKAAKKAPPYRAPGH